VTKFRPRRAAARRGLAGRKSEFDEIQLEREFNEAGAEREIKRRKGDAKELIKFRGVRGAGGRGGNAAARTRLACGCYDRHFSRDYDAYVTLPRRYFTVDVETRAVPRLAMAAVFAL